jgi:hypothetical protein
MMKLSEAIRLGSVMTGQAFNFYYIESAGAAVDTCPLGSALLAVGKLHEAVLVWQVWPWMQVGTVRCPVDGCAISRIDLSANNTISHLNDYHRWTREAIAQWVESIEPQEEHEIVPLAICPQCLVSQEPIEQCVYCDAPIKEMAQA